MWRERSRRRGGRRDYGRAMRTTVAFVACLAIGCVTKKHGGPPGQSSPGAGTFAVIEPSATPLVCPTAGGYCGGNLANGDPSTLYHCAAAGEPPASAETCGVACERMPPGTDDFCVTACPTGGGYCGDNGLGGPSTFLFQCVAGHAPPSYTACNGPCLPDPAGVDDVCGSTCSAAGAAAR